MEVTEVLIRFEYVSIRFGASVLFFLVSEHGGFFGVYHGSKGKVYASV